MSAQRVRWEGVDDKPDANKCLLNKDRFVSKGIKIKPIVIHKDTGDISSHASEILDNKLQITDPHNSPTDDVKQDSRVDHIDLTINHVPDGMVADENKVEELKPDEHTPMIHEEIENKDPLPVSPLPIQSTCSSGQATPIYPRSDDKMAARIKLWKNQGQQSALTVLSALYCTVLIVMGLAFPISQVISNKIPSSYYKAFYLYLYFTAIVFLAYVYMLLKSPFLELQFQCRKFVAKMRQRKENVDAESNLYGSSLMQVATNRLRARLGRQLDPTKSANYGSFYLRMGGVVFGVGSMIYSGLDFGQYFDLVSDERCHNILIAITPVAQTLFTFFQMYFIFLNAKMQIMKHRNRILARFGLMHMVATNMCVWLNVIIQETKHEMLFFQHQGGPEHHSVHHATHTEHSTDHGPVNLTEASHEHRVKRGSLADECRRTDLMGNLVQNASPFLFPCAIEYSLICAAIMYEIWKHSCDSSHLAVETPGDTPRSSFVSQRRSPHHYSVDCTNANKGLFFGILVLVLTIISMILFFVFINNPEYKAIAVTEVNVAELILYTMTFVAVLMGIYEMRELRFDAKGSIDLDNILLLVGQTGIVSYTIFTVIAAHFSTQKDSVLVLMTGLIALLQTTLQTMFILDASRRTSYTLEQQQRKPGREVVTFLLVTNFVMWAVTTLEKSRADAHPLQIDFYGMWPWTIITNVSRPLAIFYRYHSTVCLCEIWKRCYKVKKELIF